MALTYNANSTNGSGTGTFTIALAAVATGHTIFVIVSNRNGDPTGITLTNCTFAKDVASANAGSASFVSLWSGQPSATTSGNISVTLGSGFGAGLAFSVTGQAGLSTLTNSGSQVSAAGLTDSLTGTSGASAICIGGWGWKFGSRTITGTNGYALTSESNNGTNESAAGVYQIFTSAQTNPSITANNGAGTSTTFGFVGAAYNESGVAGLTYDQDKLRLVQQAVNRVANF